MKSGIYQIVNKLNNNLYVGSTVDLQTRKETHFRNLLLNKHCNHHLQAAYNKNPEVFEFHVIEYVEEFMLINVEQCYLNVLWDDNNSCYNISKFADAPMRGRKASKETKQKMSETRTGKKHSESTKSKMKISAKGKIFTEEHRKNIGKSSSGRKHSPETKEKMRIARIGKKYKKTLNQIAL